MPGWKRVSVYWAGFARVYIFSGMKWETLTLTLTLTPELRKRTGAASRRAVTAETPHILLEL
jgi:hypothetical protein